MSKRKVKKVVVTTKKKEKLKPTVSRSRSVKKKTEEVEFIFSKKNYQLMFIGLLLILMGTLLMTGGKMPSPDVWDDSRIYSFRRITLAPIIILAGFALEIVAIFKK